MRSIGSFHMSISIGEPHERVAILKILSGADHFRFNSHLNHLKYAKIHSYDYFFDDSIYGIDSVYDQKVRAILNLEVSDEWNFWIDDDAFFCQFEKPLTYFLKDIDTETILAFPKSPINLQGGWTYLSSGNFYFKPNEEVHDFFNKVLHTDIIQVQRWWNPDLYGIFTHGDQDRIVYQLMRNPEIRAKTAILPWDLFNYRPYHFKSRPDEHFLVHFAVNIPKIDAIEDFKTRFGFLDTSLTATNLQLD